MTYELYCFVVLCRLGHDITPEENSHYWYIIAADCSLEEYDAHPPSLKFTIEFFNGGSHLPGQNNVCLVMVLSCLVWY
mgnify:CR=1 FL=1